MRLPIFCLVCCLLLITACAQAEPTPTPTTAALPTPALSSAEGMRTFTLVPGESKAFYVMDEEFFAGALRKYNIAIGQSKTVGSTDQVQGVLQLDLENATLGSNQFTVNLPSLETDQRLRDEWIRENALESETYPLATFVATEIRNAPTNYQEGSEARFQLAGEITIREITQPVVFDVSATLDGDTLRGTAEAALKLTDFEIEPPDFAGTLTVLDDFMVRVEFVAREE